MERGALSEETFDDRMAILCDPQTSGGLLVALAPEAAPAFVVRFEELTGRAPARIGALTAAGERPAIRFVDS